MYQNPIPSLTYCFCQSLWASAAPPKCHTERTKKPSSSFYGFCCSLTGSAAPPKCHTALTKGPFPSLTASSPL